MFINITPLQKYREYRLLFIGQIVSFFGSMISYVAIPYQVYELTKDNWMVGMIGIVQLVPVLIFGILGGTFADRVNRRKLLIVSESIMGFLVLGLMINSMMPEPSVTVIFVLVGCFQAVLGFHRPAMEALSQTLVKAEDYAAVGALGGFRYSLGAIAGPSLGGLLIAQFGIHAAYLVDFLTFGAAVIVLFLMKPLPKPAKSQKSPLEDAKVGLRFALSKPELIGTYVIDIVAMVFAFPVALFPAMAQNWGGASAAGILSSAMALGALVMTVFSGWSSKVKHHGRAVVIAATLWGLAIIGVGLAPNLPLAVTFLAFAGGADMVSGLFRGVIWNETVPNELRGRLSGIEMISYMTGPLLGNARAGWIAAKFSVPVSLLSGGIICSFAVVLTAFLLPSFWKYYSKTSGTKT